MIFFYWRGSLYLGLGFQGDKLLISRNEMFKWGAIWTYWWRLWLGFIWAWAGLLEVGIGNSWSCTEKLNWWFEISEKYLLCQIEINLIILCNRRINLGEFLLNSDCWVLVWKERDQMEAYEDGEVSYLGHPN